MSIAQIRIFEDLAKATWERLDISFQVGSSLSEETLTDLNILDLARAKLPGVYVFKFNNRQEPKYGFDWEFWIGSDETSWYRIVVQAKKVDKNGQYASLHHVVKKRGVQQLEVLKEFARHNKAIPLYCFYNFSENANSQLWHCCSSPFEKSQLGCSIIPAHIVRFYLNSVTARTFESLPQQEKSLPWRCLVGCNKEGFAALFDEEQDYPVNFNNLLLGRLSLLSMLPYHLVSIYNALPTFIKERQVEGKIPNVDLSAFYESEIYLLPKSSFSDSDSRHYIPRWVVVIDQSIRGQ